jgi:hypothetical protein
MDPHLSTRTTSHGRAARAQASDRYTKNPSIGFLPRVDRNSLQKVHCVKSFSRKITRLYQQVAFQMALPDKTVGFTPNWLEGNACR